MSLHYFDVNYVLKNFNSNCIKYIQLYVMYNLIKGIGNYL